MKVRVGNLHPLLLMGGLIQVGLLLLITLGNLTLNSGVYVALFLGLFLLFCIAGLIVTGQLQNKNYLTTAKPGSLLIIIFFAVLFRLTTIFAAPTLSTDQFRYTWEGRLLTQGVSPYRYSPDDPALTPYRSEIWSLVQQRETASPYPPLSQIIGATEYLVFGDSLLGPKIAAVLFDLLTCGALLWLLSIFKRDLRLVLLYGWCPLPIIEFGQSGHNDAPMLFFLLLAVGLAVKQKPTTSAIMLGLASLAKFTPLFGLPLFLGLWAGKLNGWNWKSWFLQPRQWRYPLLTLGVVIAGYVPFLLLGGGAIGSVFEYTGTWRDNDSLFFGFSYDFFGATVAKLLSVVILGSVVLVLTFHPRLSQTLSLPRRLMLIFGTTLLVASTVHAWYLTWLLVFLPLVYGEKGFRKWDNIWLLFAMLVQLPYLTYAGNLSLYNWIKYVEYLPLYGAILWGIVVESIMLIGNKYKTRLLAKNAVETGIIETNKENRHLNRKNLE